MREILGDQLPPILLIGTVRYRVDGRPSNCEVNSALMLGWLNGYESLIRKIQGLENETLDLRLLYIGCASREEREYYLCDLTPQDRKHVEDLKELKRLWMKGNH